MEGTIDLAEEVFHMPVRTGVPQYVAGLLDVVRNPIYATGVGLLLFGNKSLQEPARSTRSDAGMHGMLERMKGWFHGSF